MYSRKIVNQRLSKLHPSFLYQENSKSDSKSIPFELEYHSPAEAHQITEHFNQLIDLDLYNRTVDKGSGKTKIELKDKTYKFSKEELRIIENERLLCKFDYDYWVTRYHKISTKENVFVQYKHTTPQLVYMHIASKLDEIGGGIFEQRGKSRQIGSTTDSQAKLQHRIQFYPDIKSITASDDKDATGVMSAMVLDSLKRQPFWLRPKIDNMQSDDYYLFENNSLLNLSWGTIPDIGRGTTPTVVHGSEVSKWLYPQEAIEAALLEAIHPNEYVLVILESTGRGRGDNYWFRLWKRNVSQLESGKNKLYPSFIPWPIREDIHPTEGWMKLYSRAYEGWKPNRDTIIYANKVRNYVTTNEDLRAVVGSNWQMSLEKLFYYEIRKEEAEEEGVLGTFLQEMPGTPDEMFQNSGSTIYPIRTILAFENDALQKIPEVYKLRGDSTEINPSFFPDEDEIDKTKPVINIRAHWNKSIPYSDYELVPIKFGGWDKTNPKNKVFIWEHPLPDFTYGSSFDPSDGLGENVSDDAVLEILRKGTIEHKTKQACEFASPELPQIEFAHWALAINTYYSKYKGQCLFTPEINDGDELLNILRNRGWWNFFIRRDMSVVGSESNVRRFGFYNDRRTRPQMINNFTSFFKGRWFDLFSIPLLEEVKDLRKKGESEKIAGENDNRVMCISIGTYALHRDEILGREKASWEKRIAAEQQQRELEDESSLFKSDLTAKIPYDLMFRESGPSNEGHLSSGNEGFRLEDL